MTKDELEKVWDNPGIYCFKNKINGMCYVGQAICIKNRFQQHLKNYKINREEKFFYYAIQEFGINNFKFSILKIIEDCDNLKEELDKWEIYYIKEKDSFNNGYNRTTGGETGNYGCIVSDDTRDKIREAAKRSCIKHRQNGYYSFYIYDNVTGETWKCLDIETASQQLGVDTMKISNATKKTRSINKRYLLGKTEEEIKEKMYLLEKHKASKETLKAMDEYLLENPDEASYRVAIKFKVGETTVRTHKKNLGIETKHNTYRLTKDEVVFVGSLCECADKIGIGNSTLSRQIHNYIGKEYRGWLIEAL